MPARFIPLGEPAHDAERQALRFLVDGLPSNFTVYGNPWLVEKTGVVYEIDAVVAAPHAIFVVEIKGYRGAIEGTDYDWYVPHAVKSPVGLNRKTAQILHARLRAESFDAGQLWTQGLVFLSATTDLGVRGPASRDRIHTRKTILAALQDKAFVERLASRALATLSPQVATELDKVLTSAPKGSRPPRRIREYELLDKLEAQDRYAELLARNALSGDERVLRIYRIPPLASDEERRRVVERARWEAQVLGRLGRSGGILKADPPFEDDAGIVLPLERFRGVTLASWLERYGPKSKTGRADLEARTDLWLAVAQAMKGAHEQGVVHRLLRPEVILVEDTPTPKEVRVTGFDLAKQLAIDTSLSLTAIPDERLRFAAPEVVGAFSSAEPASDQFSLGAILGLLLAGQPLFESTRALVSAQRLMTRVRDHAPRVPLSLDEAVTRLLALRATDRFPSLAEAIAAVRRAREPDAKRTPSFFPPTTLDPDDLPDGTRLGSDYQITSRLGQGGMATVYAARHVPSGKTRALKISRAEAGAREALDGEWRVLSGLDHPNIVRVLDPSNMVEGRLTLVMERVSGTNLRQWLAAHASRPPALLRRFAEDLLAALEHLERKSITHKDLKPDNLLVSDDGLTLIDFSLAAAPDDAPYGGTALYRDPVSARWSHGTDRYAAALCLFELYAGRHAFDGRVPEPGVRPDVEDLDPPAMAGFFDKALDPEPGRRFPSAAAMREALRAALGAEPEPAPAESVERRFEPSTPLRLTALSRRAQTLLARNGVHTAGELVALGERQIHAFHAIGTKTAEEIVALRAELCARNLAPSAPALPGEPVLAPELVGSAEPVLRLAVGPSIRKALEDAKLPTVGAVAALTRAELLAIEGVGPRRLAEVVEALARFGARTGPVEAAHSLDRVWELASRALNESQRGMLEREVGVLGEPEAQIDIAASLDVSPSTVSRAVADAIDRLDRGALGSVMAALEALVDGLGGLARLAEVRARLEEAWPAGVVRGDGLARLLVRVSAGRLQCFEVDGADGELVARPLFDRAAVKLFLGEAKRIAYEWPPIERESARRALAGVFPGHDLDPLELAARLATDLDFTDAGQLFIHPLQPEQSIGFVLGRERDGLPLAELRARVRQTFGERCTFPDADHLADVLRRLELHVEDGRIHSDRARSIRAASPIAPDPPPPSFRGRSEAEVVRDLLRDAKATSGFRMLVTPPERHAEIGPSVARALDGKYLSLEGAFFDRHGAELDRLERAERFTAQRVTLTEAVEALVLELVEAHGRPGEVVVLGDTAILGVADALDLPRRLYDDTLSGERGLWVLLVPGVIHDRQPLFNERTPLWHLEGATLPLGAPLGSSPPRIP